MSRDRMRATLRITWLLLSLSLLCHICPSDASATGQPTTVSTTVTSNALTTKDTPAAPSTKASSAIAPSTTASSTTPSTTASSATAPSTTASSATAPSTTASSTTPSTTASSTTPSTTASSTTPSTTASSVTAPSTAPSAAATAAASAAATPATAASSSTASSSTASSSTASLTTASAATKPPSPPVNDTVPSTLASVSVPAKSKETTITILQPTSTSVTIATKEPSASPGNHSTVVVSSQPSGEAGNRTDPRVQSTTLQTSGPSESNKTTETTVATTAPKGNVAATGVPENTTPAKQKPNPSTLTTKGSSGEVSPAVTASDGTSGTSSTPVSSTSPATRRDDKNTSRKDTRATAAASTTAASRQTTATKFTGRKDYNFSLEHQEGKTQNKDEKALIEVCKMLASNLKNATCSFTVNHNKDGVKFETAKITGEVDANKAQTYYDQLEPNQKDNKTLIAILASCGALLIMLVILCVCFSHRRKPYNENQQRLTEGMHIVENGYHDNPTLEVMEVQPEMQEKKAALKGECNDAYIIPFDHLQKEDIPDEEDTHL